MTNQADIDRLDRIANRMDSAVRIPGTRLSFGLDSVLGLVPGIGDALALAPATYILWSAHRHGVPRRTLGRMAFNTGLDVTLGSVPVLGDIFDLFFKANRRNVALLKQHLQDRLDQTEPSQIAA